MLKNALRTFLFTTITAALVIAVLIGALLIYDRVIFESSPSPIPDADSDTVTMRTFEYYPYSENHIQAYVHEKGKLLWTSYYNDFDVSSGDHGFFVDIDIDFPPVKEKGEYRILLVGGSAAQGWGGRTNDHMFYRLLEQRLTKDLVKNGGRISKIRVINLAMGGATTKNNYIVLNKWGHKLEPDLILSFAGHNEIAVPLSTNSDTSGSNFGGMARIQRYSSSSDTVKLLAKYFPGIIKRTTIGMALRLKQLNTEQTNWFLDYVLGHYDPEYRGGLNPGEQMVRFKQLFPSTDTALEKLCVPLYVDALRSIKRDFLGLPMIVVFQPLASRTKEYDFLRPAVRKQIQGYLNRDTIVYDLQTVWEDNDYFPGSFVDSCHLTNEGHVLVTEYLARFLEPYILSKAGKSSHKQAVTD